METYTKWRDRIVASDGASYWLKNQVLNLDNRDPVDAADDVEVLSLLCERRINELFQGTTG